MELFLHTTYATKWEEHFGVIYFWMGRLMNTGWAKNSPNFKSGQNWFFLCYIIFSKFFYGIQFRCWLIIKKYHFELGSYGWTRGPIQSLVKIFVYFSPLKIIGLWFFWTPSYQLIEFILDIIYAILCKEFFGIIYFRIGHLTNTGWAKNYLKMVNYYTLVHSCYYCFQQIVCL